MRKKILNYSNYLAGGLFNILLVVVIVIVGYLVATWAFDQFTPQDVTQRPFYEISIEIPEEATALEAARILRENNLINNEWTFYLSSVLNGSSSHFLYGTFALNTHMSEPDLMEALQSMSFLKPDEGRIVIIEGLTNRQIAQLSATLGYFTAAEFLYEAENGFFNHEFLVGVGTRTNRLEGFLFPDTYNLPPNPSPRDLIVRMLDRFEGVFGMEQQIQLEQLSSQMGRNIALEELIIVASIVEAEAVLHEERPTVAAVIFNRLAAGMPLEMITTVVYATDTTASRLTAQHFASTSPYNTFNRVGLPVGPISNPSFSAIDAALNPANVDYLFMLKLEDGSHFFSNTQAAHDAAAAALAQ
ncbi:MAG: endolytic transglycosylase MltG [Defluviitaleaceae bacterium]|nr:endolytic transglycosylase MltG [Defluviitaleaceae bacterium]